MRSADRLVTFDNNILIDLRKNEEPTATYARQLLDFSRHGKITVGTTLSTILEKQRPGEAMSIPELIAWLEEIGFTREYMFMGPRTVAFNVQGETIWGDIERELALNQCIHHAIFPHISFSWYDYLDQQCLKLGIVGTRQEAIIDLDNQKYPYIPYSPQAPQQRPIPALDALEQDEREALSVLYEKLFRKWMNKKNDALGLYNHLTNAVHTTYPDQSIFVTCDNDFLNKIKALRRCGFRGEILQPANAIAFIETVIA